MYACENSYGACTASMVYLILPDPCHRERRHKLPLAPYLGRCQHLPQHQLHFIHILPSISDGDIAITGIARGGVRNLPRSRSRSLSPTMPFVIDDDEQDHDLLNQEHSPYIQTGAPILQETRPPPSPLPSDEEDGCCAIPPSDPYHTPERFAARRHPSPPSSREGVDIVDCSPQTPPPAQHDKVDKPIPVNKTQEIRYIRAHPRANVERVLDRST